MNNWKTDFDKYAVPVEIEELANLYEGVEDTSKRDDAMPSFSFESGNDMTVRIWIDKPKMWGVPGPTRPRFYVEECDDIACSEESCYEGGDLREAIAAFLAARLKVDPYRNRARAARKRPVPMPDMKLLALNISADVASTRFTIKQLGAETRRRPEISNRIALAQQRARLAALLGVMEKIDSLEHDDR